MSSDLHRVVKSLVKAEFAGKKVLDYLVEKFQYNDTAAWQEIIDDDRIKINGIPAKSESILQKDDSLEYHHIDHQEPEVDFDYQIISKTDNYLVINKPGNLPVHPAGPFFHNTLWAALKKQGYEPHFINRLDRETSGLLLVAINKESASKLGKQTQKKQIYKEYLTIVEGEFLGPVEARGYLEKDSKSNIDKRLIFIDDKDFETYGKSGVDSSFSLVKNIGDLSLIKCIIRTGKMHQIRATLYSLGFPLVGDKIYGVDESFYLKFIHNALTHLDYQKMRMKRQALHAHILKFKDPATGQEVVFECELPEDMKKVLEQK